MDDPLAADTTTMLDLDLTQFGGGYDLYRFTRLDLGKASSELLIELEGASGNEGLRTEDRRLLKQRFDDAGFTGGMSLGDGNEFDQVPIAFERAPVSQTRRNTAGGYGQATHTVSMFDSAFGWWVSRLGRAGHPITFAASAVIGIVGHAADLTALRTAGASKDQAQAALLAGLGTGPAAQRRYQSSPARDPKRQRHDDLLASAGAAAIAKADARPRSGARWVTKEGVTTIQDTDATAPTFRQAALKDGAGTSRFATLYRAPKDVWQEYFAESFVLFQSAPETLWRMRPNDYLYFEQELPHTP